MNVILLDRASDSVKVTAAGNFTASAKTRSAFRRPPADAHPVHLLDLAFDESLEAIGDAEHDMAAIESDAHRRTHGGIHARCRRAAVHHGEAQLLLARHRRMRE